MTDLIILGDLVITERKPVPEAIPLGMVVVGGKQARVAHYVLTTKRLALSAYNAYPELGDRAPVQVFRGTSSVMMMFGSLADAIKHKNIFFRNIDCVPMALLADPVPARRGKAARQFYPLPKAHLDDFRRLTGQVTGKTSLRPSRKAVAKPLKTPLPA